MGMSRKYGKTHQKRKPEKNLKFDGKPCHYRVRQAALKELGFSTYKDYLESELWLTIRTRILERDDHKCRICRKKKAVAVHHTTYSILVLAGKMDTQLMAVCGGCHKRVEFADDKKLRDAHSVFKAVLRTSKARSGGIRVGRTELYPACRCCGRPQKKTLGRDGICLMCFKKYRERVHIVAREREERLLAT